MCRSKQVDLQRNIQLSTTEVEEASCTIRALGPRMTFKELVLDLEGRPRDVTLKPKGFEWVSTVRSN